MKPRNIFLKIKKKVCHECIKCVLDVTQKSESERRSVLTLCDSQGLYSPWNSPGQSTGVGSWYLLQGIFPTQGSNPGLLPCRQILYQLSHQGSPDIDMIYNSEAAPSPSSKVLEGHLKEMMSELSQRLSRCEPSQGKSRTNSTITEFQAENTISNTGHNFLPSSECSAACFTMKSLCCVIL